MRILHFGLSSNVGGIETYLLKMTRALDQSRYHFDFVDLGGAVFRTEFQQLGSEFFAITPRRKSPVKSLIDWHNLFSRQEFDVLHCHLNTLSYVAPIRMALSFGLPVIVHSRSSSVRGSAMTRLSHEMNRRTLPWGRLTKVAVSDLAGDWMFGGRPFQVINNGVEIERFRFSAVKRASVRSQLALADDAILLGHIGAFLPVKNHEFLLQVFCAWADEEPRAVLLLVGEGPLRGEVLRQARDLGIEEKVLFLGKRSDISSLLAAMDVFILPSMYEGFSNALLEAQCSGLPCVVSDRISAQSLILGSTRAVSLKRAPRDWAGVIGSVVSTEWPDRRFAADQIGSLGFSVRDEALKLARIYDETVLQS